MERGIVIVGGGLAGAAVAESYRKAGGTDRLLIVSADDELPVHRPPLSKEYLRGDEILENVYVHPASFYLEQQIDVRLGTRVDAIDRAADEIVLSGGERIAYRTLVLATGARSRSLPVPGAELSGVFYLRSLRSSDELRRAYSGARRAVIIGAGFIGMEVAATLARRGISCTVIEMGPRAWPAIVPPLVSEFIHRYYHERGVNLRFNVSVQRIEGEGTVERVVLSDGEILAADLVVAGVGAALNTELAADAGLQVERGVVVDERLRTADPHIYAVGDIANFPDPIGGRTHLEHWDNALHQGRFLGEVLAGSSHTYEHVPYFFSDLFDLSLNMIGYSSGWDEVVLRGNPADDSFTVIYGKSGIIRAALMVNDDEYFNAWTRLVGTRQTVAASLSHLGEGLVSATKGADATA